MTYENANPVAGDHGAAQRICRSGRNDPANSAKPAPTQATPRDLRTLLHSVHWGRHRTRHIAEDPEGRAMLTAALHCGLDPEEARMDRAPWLSDSELERLQHAARELAFDDIGPLIRLTPPERILYKARRFRPLGMSWEAIEQAGARRRGEAQAKEAAGTAEAGPR